LTGGEAHDGPLAERLICRVEPAKCLLGDKAYDSNELRADLDEQGTKPVIPNRSNRKQPFSFSKRLYKLRWRIEAAFNRLKDFRRIATRYYIGFGTAVVHYGVTTQHTDRSDLVGGVHRATVTSW